MGWNRHLMGGGGVGIGLKLCSNGPEAKTDFSHGGLIGTLGMRETELFVNLQCFQGELKADKKIQYTIINNRNKISHMSLIADKLCMSIV